MNIRPTHVLKAFDKETEYTAEVGIGWEKTGKEGSYISISLLPGVHLEYKDGLMLTLFPKNFRKDGSRPNSSGG